MPVNFTTATFDDGDGPMWAILPSDDTDGFVIGEWGEVENLHEALGHLIETQQANEEIHHLDERLGWKWLSVSEAAREWDVSADTVRYAAREGHIANVKKQGSQWRFPQANFLHWLKKVHRPRG